MLHVALLEPEIAGNAGQIGRTCLAAGARLHLVRPLGFRLDAASLQRAGMDYWERVDLRVHASWAAFRQALAPAFDAGRVLAFTSRAQRGPEVPALGETPGGETGEGPPLVLLFGCESRGLPDAVLAEAVPVRLPMRPGVRSLNLSAAVAAALYLVWSERAFQGGS